MKPEVRVRFNGGDLVITIEPDGYLTCAEALLHSREVASVARALVRVGQRETAHQAGTLRDALLIAREIGPEVEFWLEDGAPGRVRYRLQDGRVEWRFDDEKRWFPDSDKFSASDVMSESWRWRLAP